MDGPPVVTPVQWRVRLFAANEVIQPRTRYDFDNTRRQPPRATVVQLTLEGRLIYRDFDGSEREVLPGQLLLLNHGETTRYYLPEGRDYVYRSAWVQMEGAGLAEHLNEVRRRHGSILSLDTTGLSRPFQLLQETVAQRARRSPIEDIEAVHRFVMELLRCSEDTQARAMTPVQRAVELIRTEPTRPWSLKQLAREYGCTREHLIRVFRRVTGKSPGMFLAAERLRCAIELLENTQLSLDLVARQSGYAKVSTMARRVRDETGLSPTQLRARAQRGGCR